MTRVFGTGLTGTIGAHLITHGVEPLDFRNLDLVAERLASVKEKFSVIHLAGIVGVNSLSVPRGELYEINCYRTSRLFEISQQDGKLVNFVFASSSHVYKSSGTALKETSEVEPNSIYADSKLLAERILQSHSRGNELTIARIFSVLGLVGDRPGTLGHAALEVLTGKRDSPIRWALDERDFSHPQAIAGQLVNLALRQPAGVVNVASGRRAPVHVAITNAASKVGLGVGDNAFRMELSEDPIRHASIQKLAALLSTPHIA